MIHYALRCDGGHEFDGWFKSSISFDAQAAGGLLDCPVCASTVVTRALMAPRISQGIAPPCAPQPQPPQAADGGAPAAQPVPVNGAQPNAAVAVAPPASPEPVPAAAMPDQVRAVLQRIRSDIEKTCEYVGPDFAREVRRMAGARKHSPGADRPYRPVYGEATPDEAAALIEDGIDVTRIPWVPRADS
jgi:hypothetical protein